MALTDRVAELRQACRRHRVSRLDVFGSAVRLDEGANDLDFLVEFEDLPDGDHADAYFGLLEDLVHRCQQKIQRNAAPCLRACGMRVTLLSVPVH